MYVCLWNPDWLTAAASGAEAAILLAEHAPRLRAEREVIWADGRGLDAPALAERLIRRLADEGAAARAGVAAVPVTAELAARWGEAADHDGDGPTPFLVKERTGWGHRKAEPRATSQESEGVGSSGSEVASGAGVVVVERGAEAQWQSTLPISALRPDTRTKALFDGVGLATVGQLAGLEREAVEVRFGGAVVALWRAARADDRRLLFDRIPPERPHGSLDFVDYVLTDPARLIFTANALLTPLCEGLVDRGAHARTLRLVLPLANGEAWERTLRPARPTASQETWLRLIRGLLEKITVPDAVSGMRIEVPTTEAAAVRQGDLFDRGFATATAVEAAVARLAERQVWPVAPETDAHPRIERRGEWTRRELGDAVHAHRAGTTNARSPGPGRALTLQLMKEPRRIAVETERRRDHEMPVRLRDRGGWQAIPQATGPDRISGGQWEDNTYAREYYRCVTDGGVPLWIYRDALAGGWYLQGWWD